MIGDDVRRRLYLIQELDVSLLAIAAGLAELHGSLPYRSRYFVFLLLLSTGLERLLKIVLHLRALETTGAFLSRDEMKNRYGHNLVGLCNAVVTECFTPEHLTRPATQADLRFVRDDPILRPMLELLSDFATADRYIYMNGISDPGDTAEWPERRWQELESSTLPRGEFVRLYMAGEEPTAKDRATRALVACLERFVRAVARLFVWGALGDQARQVSPAVSDYLRLMDEDLGSRDHRR